MSETKKGGDKHDKPKPEGFIDKAKHALTEAIYGKAPEAHKPQAVEKGTPAKPVDHKHLQTSQKTVDHTQGQSGKKKADQSHGQTAAKTGDHPQGQPGKKHGDQSHGQTAAKTGDHPQGQPAQKSGLNFKQVASYLNESAKSHSPAEKLLDAFKTETKTVLNTVEKAVKPVEDTLKTIGKELHHKERIIADALTGKHTEETHRKPRHMTAEESKREERIAHMNPEERARFKVTQHEDPKTHVIYNYNQKGLITDSETLNGHHKHIDYKAGSKEPASLKVSQVSADDSKTLVEHKADANHRILINQSTGDVRVDSKQKSADGKPQKVEEHFGADGTQTKIVSQHGHRLTKEMYSPGDEQLKKVATLDYKYTDDKNKPISPDKVDAHSKCIVIQTDSRGSVRHQFAFESVSDTKAWKPKTQVDVSPPQKDATGVTIQKSVTYDLTKGKVPVSESDVTTKTQGDSEHQKTETYTFDHAQKKTKVSETDVSVVTKGTISTQTTESFDYVKGQAQKVFHSQETLDKASGNSSAEEFSYSNGNVVAKDFARKEVNETSGDTKVSTTVIRKEKIVQHKEALFDGKGHAVSLDTQEGGHNYSVKFGTDDKVASSDGKPAIVKDGKPMSTDGLPDEEKKKIQTEMKSLSGGAVQYMQETQRRYDVRAQVNLTQSDTMSSEDADRKSAADRVKAGKTEFTDKNDVHYRCDPQGRIIEQTKDSVSTTVTYDGVSFRPSHITIKPPGTADGGEYHADAFKQLQINQESGDIRVTQLNAKGFKVWEDNFAPADNLAARTTYSYLDKERHPAEDPNKIDPTQVVTAHATNREGKVTDQYQFADAKHATTRNADQHIQFDPLSGQSTKMEMRVKAPRGGDSLIEYTLKDGKVTSTHQDGVTVKDAAPEQISRIEAYLKGMQEQFYPKQAPSPNDQKPDADASKPRELTVDDKLRLRAIAAEVHKQAGYDNYVFTYADGMAIEKTLASLKDQAEVDEFKRQYRIASNGEDLEKQLGACDHFKDSGAYLLKALLSRDDATVTAYRVRRGLQEHQESIGRTQWEIDADLRHSLGHLDSKQMQAAEAKFRELFPEEGSMHSAILSFANVPQDIKDSVPYYVKGVDKLTERDKLKMADIAIESKNLDMFKEVTARFDDKTRATFESSTQRQSNLKDAFSGRKLEEAQAAGKDGFNLIAQEIRDNSGAWTNREGVRNALAKLSDEQRRQYSEGRELENKGSRSEDLTEEQNKSVRLYQCLHKEIFKAVILDAERTGLEDNITLKGGGLISELSKGAGYTYNTGVQEQLDKVANMSESDWQKLHDYVKGVNGAGHPEYRLELEKTLRDMKGYRIQEEEVNKILALYDKKMGAGTFTESKLAGQKDVLDVLYSQRGLTHNDRGGALDAIAKMTPEEQKRYRTDFEFQKKIDAQLDHFKQFSNTDAYDQAQRMLNMYRTDHTGVLSQFRNLNNLSERERQGIVSDPTALKSLQDSINQMPENESKHAAQRMLSQMKDGRPPELMDVFGKLAATRSQWTGDPRETVRAMEEAFKDDPSLFKRIQNPQTAEDRKISAQFKELSASALGINSSYGEALIKSTNGHLALDQKLDMDRGWLWNDRQGIIKDIAGASEEEKSQLKDRTSPLRQKVDKSMNDWLQGHVGMTERDRGQQQVVERILQTCKVETQDKLRSYILDVGYSSDIMALLHNTPPDKLDQLSAEYSKNYHRDLRSDLMAKLNKSDSTEALNMFYKPTSSEDLYRHVLDQYLDSRSGFGSYFADNVGRSGTGHQLDNSINQITAIMAEAHKSGKPLSPEQEKLLIGNVNTAVETFTKDLSNFKESKAACAEYTSQGVMAALTVAGALVTGGGSLVAEGGLYAGLETTAAGLEVADAVEATQALSGGARALQYLRTGVQFTQSASGNALMNTGLQMAMRGNDYDISSIPGDLATGFVQGKMFECAGPTQAGRLLRLGEGTATLTTEKACTVLLKDEALGLTKTFTSEEGQKVFQSALKREIASSIRETMLQGGTELAPNALRTATGTALREAVETELKQNAGKIGRHELETRVQQELAKFGQGQISSCEKVLASSLHEASQQQCKNLIKGLIEFSGDQSHLVTRFTRGLGMSTMGGGLGGTASGVMEGLINWDRSKTFEENMTAMREHVTGSIVSSMIGAMQMHPIGMIGHHMQSHAAQNAGKFLSTTEVAEGTIHKLKNGTIGFTDHSGGQMLNEGGKVVAIRDAEGKQTHIAYDQTGAIRQLDMNTPQGSQRWTRQEDGNWKVDTARGSFETSTKVTVGGDGRMVFEREDGTTQIKNLDGSIRYINHDGTQRVTNLNEDLQRRKFENVLANQVTKSDLHGRLLTDMDILSERIITNGKDRAELAKTSLHVTELLQEAARPNHSPKARERLQQVAEEMLWMAAHPALISQGWHPTCPLASAQSRLFTEYPGEAARIMKELAIHGEYRCPDGTVLKPFTADGANILEPDADALSHYEGKGDRADGRRLLASQMFQTLLISAHYADHEYFNNEFIGKGNIGYLNDHIVDMRTNPPRVLSKEEGPLMNASDVTRAFEKLTGRHEDFVLLNRRYADSLNINPDCTFNSPEELGGLLFGNQRRGKLPISLQLNTFHEPFYTDSGAHRSAGDGGEHMLNAVKIEVAVNPGDPRSIREINPKDLFDPVTGKLTVNPADVYVSVTNQWDKASQHLIKKVLLTDLYTATTNPLDIKNVRALEKQVHSEPENLAKQLDLLRYKHEFEKRREALSEKAAANPTGHEAAQLAGIDKARDCVSPTKLVEDIDRLTNLKMQEIAARDHGFDHATKEDVAMLDKARGLLKSAQRDIEARTAADHEGGKAPAAHKNLGDLSPSERELPGARKGDTELLRRQIDQAEIKLEKLRLQCLQDAKVPNTLSEFGFEYKLASAIEDATIAEQKYREEHPNETARERKARLDQTIVTAFIDLNNFKNVNVLHSMEMGDKALRQFGIEASKVLRKYGIDPREALGHFGGDEFGILLKNQKHHAQILNEIMSIRIGCKPLSTDAYNQQKCGLVVLGKDENFKHTAYKIETDAKTGQKKVLEQPSPVISATLGAVRWKPEMSAENVLQAADKVMFEKKPLVKLQLNAGGNAVFEPFSDKRARSNVVEIPESEQLNKFRRLSATQKEFVSYGMTHAEMEAYKHQDLKVRQDLYFDLLNKHRHTQILDRTKSKEALAKYIERGDKEPFTIIRLSIDNFKPVNDLMKSHAKGNRVLKEVGTFIRTLDADFVGSLGGTSPFLIVKDPAKADEIMKKCDKFFLKVSAKKPDPEKIDNFKEVSKTQIAVGLSAGKVQWQHGMDIETLLNQADVETEAMQEKHIGLGRHTRREPANQVKEGETFKDDRRGKDSPPDGSSEQPKSFKMGDDSGQEHISLAQNFDHGSKTKGNRPDVSVGNWTYSDFDGTKRVVTEHYVNQHMHVREAILDHEGNQITKEHPFFTRATMDSFADAISPMLEWSKMDPRANRQAVLEERTLVAQNAINEFLRKQNLPPIILEAGAAVDVKLTKLRGKAGYKEGAGRIMVRTSDLLNASDPAFVAALYHEIMHAEQDVAIIRATALDTLQLRRAREAEQKQVEPKNNSATDSTGNEASVAPNMVRRQYSKTRGHLKANWDPTAPETEEKLEIAAWFETVLKQDQSKDWIKSREDTSQKELKAQDFEYRRADWLRTSYRTGEASGNERPLRETPEMLEIRIKLLQNKIDDDSSTRPFKEDEVNFLKSLRDNPADRIKTYGYNPLDKLYEKRDETFTNLLENDPKFAKMVQAGNRRNWIPAYEKHIKELEVKAHECDAHIELLDRHAPDYQERLQKLVLEKPDFQDSPRTLKMLTRWELKGLIHGMEERRWAPVYSSSDDNWNYALADHVSLVGEDGLNQSERLRYSLTMRTAHEQLAYREMAEMTEIAAQRVSALKAGDLPAPLRRSGSDETGLVHSREQPSDTRLASLSREELQLQAGGEAASDRNIALLSDTLSIAGDRLMVVDLETNESLRQANQKWETADTEARNAITQRFPNLLPHEFDRTEDLFYDRKFVREALTNHPDLLEKYEKAISSYVDYCETYRDEINTSRRVNAAIINGALAELAEYTNEPALEIFTAKLGSATAAHKLGTNRLFISDDALRGLVPIENLIKDISHEVSHNTQNSLVVRKMANDLQIGKHPTDEEIVRLQAEYEKQVGQRIEPEYLLSALKGNRNISEGDKLRAEELIGSFSEIKDGDDLRDQIRLVDWAVKKLNSSKGAGALMEHALNQADDLKSISENSLLTRLFPSYPPEQIMRMLNNYLDNGPSWRDSKNATCDFWKGLLETESAELQKSIAAHDEKYSTWAHEKEFSAMAELVSRELVGNQKKRWQGSQVDEDILMRWRQGDDYHSQFFPNHSAE